MLSVRNYFEFVRFSHTVFALPFALASMTVAAGGWPRSERGKPGWVTFLLILTAMVCARTAAMGFNRIVDREFDARNPRTKGRHLPSGRIRLAAAWALVVVASFTFVGMAGLINGVCLRLSPLALLIVFFYSLTKRFTFLSHLFLGLALAVAPVGAWLAVRGSLDWSPLVLAVAVVLWVAGFDIIYATQDIEADKALGLYSLPVAFDIAGSLRVARWAHGAMLAALAGFGLISGLGGTYYGGLALIAGCLVYEHRLAGKGDPVSLNVASLRVNGLISVIFLVAVVLDVVCR
jgi:4-hydroxybenzoate polyprenyltransferase